MINEEYSTLSMEEHKLLELLARRMGCSKYKRGWLLYEPYEEQFRCLVCNEMCEVISVIQHAKTHIADSNLAAFL